MVGDLLKPRQALSREVVEIYVLVAGNDVEPTARLDAVIVFSREEAGAQWTVAYDRDPVTRAELVRGIIDAANGEVVDVLQRPNWRRAEARLQIEHPAELRVRKVTRAQC